MSSADKARVGLAADGPAPPEEEEGEGGGEAGGKEPAADAAPGPSAAFRFLVTRREPAVKLQYAVSGLEPLAWSEDHRVSVSTARSIAVLELICDVHNPGQDLVIHRTSVPAPLNSCLLKTLPLQLLLLSGTDSPRPSVGFVDCDVPSSRASSAPKEMWSFSWSQLILATLLHGWSFSP
uniref:General transcription factor IIIC subunit 4 n=1 Tax=Suricata suricatta TaxID=37032 RepID=A0A673VT89_SURSU